MSTIGEKFEWDENKNRINFQKHRVSFNEAQTVFSDEFILFFPDDEHSQDEERFIAIGESAKSRLLIVCHCYRDDDAITRLISARKADNSEVELYYGGII
jgi:uncharacterized DUF497 family protein